MLWRKLDDWRVSWHFKRVESILRAQDVSQLAPSLQRARERHLDQLHAYAVRGIFPRNYEQANYAPCFIDRDGRECAVAHLVMASGHAAMAETVAAVANYAYVPQMEFPELDKWAAESGLNRKELALIQPGYYLTFSGELLWLALLTWATSVIAIGANVIQLRRRGIGIVIPVIAFVVGVILLLISFVCLSESWMAFKVGTDGDTSQFVREGGVSAFGPLLLGGLISLGLSLLAGGIGFYRIHRFVERREMRDTLAE